MSTSDDLSITAYAGQRETVQYQSIPAGPQRNPTHPGGVIDLSRHYQGVDSRLTHRDTLWTLPVDVTVGLNYENMSENRKGFENFTLDNGVPLYGVKGDKRRDERNLMWNLDPYLQSSWQLSDALSLDAGVRYSSIWFDANDHYITAANGDDSGEASYHKWLPAGALKYKVTDAWNVYLSAGRGFETPTINELSYRSGGQNGLNLALKPSTSDTVELGSKTRIGNGLFSAALFQTDTDNEIVVDASSGGGLEAEDGLDLAGCHLPQQRLWRDGLQRQPHARHRAQYGLRLVRLSAGTGLVCGRGCALYGRYHGGRREQRQSALLYRGGPEYRL